MQGSYQNIESIDMETASFPQLLENLCIAEHLIKAAGARQRQIGVNPPHVVSHVVNDFGGR